MKEISFLIFLIFIFLFLISTFPFANEFRTDKSLFQVIKSLEKQKKPGAKRIKYFFIAALISLGAFFLFNIN